MTHTLVAMPYVCACVCLCVPVCMRASVHVYMRQESNNHHKTDADKNLLAH